MYIITEKNNNWPLLSCICTTNIFCSSIQRLSSCTLLPVPSEAHNLISLPRLSWEDSMNIYGVWGKQENLGGNSHKHEGKITRGVDVAVRDGEVAFTLGASIMNSTWWIKILLQISEWPVAYTYD